MKSESQIRFEFLRTDFRRYRHLVLVAIAVIIFVLWVTWPATQMIEQVSGTVIGAHSKNSGKGIAFFVRIKLESGEEVLVRSPSINIQPKTGSKVDLALVRNTLFSSQSYEFIEYRNE